jgi:hypothetical protein
VADDGVWALAAVGLALVAASGSFGFVSDADAAPASTVLATQVGLDVSLARVQVLSVPADEGFWVSSDHGRLWVQIDTARESPYTVAEGDVVSLSGRVVAHNPSFPGQVGVNSGEGAGDLAAQGAHITIPLNGLAFNS